MSDLSVEMRFFFLHREVSLSLSEMAYLYSQGLRPDFDQLVDWVGRRRGRDDELPERTTLILAHLQEAVHGANRGEPEGGVAAWFATAEPIVAVYVLGSAATRAGNCSADQAQQYAITLERK